VLGNIGGETIILLLSPRQQYGNTQWYSYGVKKS